MRSSRGFLTAPAVVKQTARKPAVLRSFLLSRDFSNSVPRAREFVFHLFLHYYIFFFHFYVREFEKYFDIRFLFL